MGTQVLDLISQPDNQEILDMCEKIMAGENPVFEFLTANKTFLLTIELIRVSPESISIVGKLTDKTTTLVLLLKDVIGPNRIFLDVSINDWPL